jgi:hypothetical protein
MDCHEPRGRSLVAGRETRSASLQVDEVVGHVEDERVAHEAAGVVARGVVVVRSKEVRAAAGQGSRRVDVEEVDLGGPVLVAVADDHDRPGGLVHEHLVVPDIVRGPAPDIGRAEVDRRHGPRRTGTVAEANREQPAPPQHDHVLAPGLDDASLIDARHLDIGDALGGRSLERRSHGHFRRVRAEVLADVIERGSPLTPAEAREAPHDAACVRAKPAPYRNKPDRRALFYGVALGPRRRRELAHRVGHVRLRATAWRRRRLGHGRVGDSFPHGTWPRPQGGRGTRRGHEERKGGGQRGLHAY